MAVKKLNKSCYAKLVHDYTVYIMWFCDVIIDLSSEICSVILQPGPHFEV